MKVAQDATRPTVEQRRAEILEYARVYMRNRRMSDPEGMRKRRRDHMRSYSPEYRHKWNHYNRLRRQQVDIPDEQAQEYALILRGDPCCYCGAPMKEIDHIHPLALGGDGSWANLTAACLSCNRRKNAKPLLMFLLHKLEAA